MPHASTRLDAVFNRIASSRDTAIANFKEILGIPSVSADPAHDGDCQTAAEWVRDQLLGIGFQAQLAETGGHPAVLAHHPGPDGGDEHPGVIFYSHYDVQPPDPLDLWQTAPFEPVMVEGPDGPQMVARGASDNKGQLISWIEALRAFVAVEGAPPVPVSVVVEGEEEVGSPTLEAFLLRHRAEIVGGVVLANDASMWDRKTPALVTRLRGMLYTQVNIRCASQDVHSGLYGGAAVNPLRVLASILANMHDEQMRVAIPHFYDDVIEADDAEKAYWHGLGFDERAYLSEVGLSTAQGEAGRGALERLWARPTAEVNGIWGGYTGTGSKTVIPAQAHAKVSFRLVANQNPATIAERFKSYIAAQLPADAHADVEVISSSRATNIPLNSMYVKAALASLTDEFGTSAVRTGTGGSLPVINAFEQHLGVPSLLYGWAQTDDNPHGPNEKFELELLEKGARAHVRILMRLSSLHAAGREPVS